MKILISSAGKDPKSPMDTRFGRAEYFIIFDTDTGSFKLHENKQNLNAIQGAGIQAAQNASSIGADVVITGNVGPKAYATLTASGIKIFLGNNGTVKENLDRYIEGKLTEADSPNVKGHWS